MLGVNAQLESGFGCDVTATSSLVIDEGSVTFCDIYDGEPLSHMWSCDLRVLGIFDAFG